MTKYLLLLLAIATWTWVVIDLPPGGVSWEAFFQEQAPVSMKIVYLAQIYLWPAALSLATVILFQLQLRLSMSGAGTVQVFSLSLLASIAMLAGLRSLASASNALPGYVIGMAVGYTLMSRLYAVQRTKLWGRLPFIRIVWRGDLSGVSELNRRIATMQAAGCAEPPMRSKTEQVRL